MTKLPTTPNEIDDYYEQKPQAFRQHLGCSLIGHKCDRYLWYSFRWSFKEQFSGRMLRLFDVGHKFEAEIIKDLRNCGVDVRSSQDRVDFGSHVSGSVDGIVYSGLIESPTKKHVIEFKTHSEKSFNQLNKEGVEKAKPLHYVQMQTYMLGLKIDRAYYLAINKNTSELYGERIKLDEKFAQKYVDRAKRITLLERKPEPMSADPTWYECSYCSAREMCHNFVATKQVNCRTCAHSTPKEDSTWHCARWDDTIPDAAQVVGCDSHVLHPDLVPYSRKDSSSEWSAIYIINGKPVVNGEDGFKSSEIVANPNTCADPDQFVTELRDTMGARIINAS